MKLNIDTRNTETKVVDAKLIQYGTPEEIIRLQGNVDNKMYVIVADIIANSIGLTDSERQVYICILAHTRINSNVNISEVLSACSRINGKSRLTYKRGLDVLIKMGIAKYADNRTAVVINPKYDAGSVNGHQAKFIVIELTPNTA